MNKQISYIFSSKLFRILAFLLLFVFLTNTVLSRFVKPYKDETLAVNLKTTKKQDFDVVFMSNSYLYTAYDPLLLNSLTGLSSIHLGTSARRFCFEPFILNQILKKRQPKIVVLDISTSTISMPNSDHSWFFNNKAIANFTLSLDKIEMLKSILPKDRSDLWLQSFSAFTRNLFGITSEEKLIYYPKERNVFKGKVLGYNARIKQNLKSIEKYKVNYDSIYYGLMSKSSISQDLESAIKKEFIGLLSVVREYPEVQFLLIHNVKLKSSTEKQVTIERINKIIDSYDNVKLLELNTKEIKNKLDLNFIDFYDGGHVMQSGSLKITSYFSDYLKQNYDFVNHKKIDSTPYVFKIKGSENILKVKDIKVLFAEDYSTDIRVVIDSIPEGFNEVSTILNIFPKEKYKHLLEDKSKKNKWKSDNAYRKFKNYLQIKNGYVGKLNSWSKLKPEHIDRVEIKFSGSGITTETKILDLNKVNIFQAK
jgi:hypothetical protein